MIYDIGLLTGKRSSDYFDGAMWNRTLLTHNSTCSPFLYRWSSVPASTVGSMKTATDNAKDASGNLMPVRGLGFSATREGDELQTVQCRNGESLLPVS